MEMRSLWKNLRMKLSRNYREMVETEEESLEAKRQAVLERSNRIHAEIMRGFYTDYPVSIKGSTTNVSQVSGSTGVYEYGRSDTPRFVTPGTGPSFVWNVTRNDPEKKPKPGEQLTMDIGEKP